MTVREGLLSAYTHESREALLTEVNDVIRGMVARLDPSADQEWEFLCECIDLRCSEMLAVSLAQYDERRRHAEPIVAPDHPVAQARAARARSEALREAAAGLKAQARLQLERARRLMQRPG